MRWRNNGDKKSRSRVDEKRKRRGNETGTLYQKGIEMSTERMTGLMGEVISSLPIGKEKAISREELAWRLQIPDRSTRRIIEELRDQGIMICNDQDGKGYYIAQTTAEVERQYRRDLARAKNIMKRLRASRMLLQAAGRETA